MNEAQWDKKLNIQTIGRVDAHADAYHYPYEPTPYSVLERLAKSGWLSRRNILIDYGCGKGRVGCFLRYVIGCRTIGVEYNAKMYRQAVENQRRFGKEVSFVCANAEEYPVEDADSFYFFNPFSVEILKGVLWRIMESYYEKPRKMRLFFYYPNDAYLLHLLSLYSLSYAGEIDCRDLFDGKDERERILIFEIGT